MHDKPVAFPSSSDRLGSPPAGPAGPAGDVFATGVSWSFDEAAQPDQPAHRGMGIAYRAGMQLLSRQRLEDRRLALVLLAAALAVFISQCVQVGQATVDDAFFTLSFAKNLALGHGPVYSHGVRVEGHSAFLWMLVMALPLVFTRGDFLLEAARVMGAPFVLLLGWATYRLARTAGASRVAAAACVLLLAFNTDLAVAYLTGMETVAFVALVAAAFATHASALVDPSSRWRTLAPYCALAVALTRIDGFLPMGFLLGAHLLAEAARGRPQLVSRLARLWAVPLGIYGLWFLWRWWYYGMPLPSTYYAKALIPTLLPRRGLEYVTDELIGGGLLLGLAPFLWLLWRQRLVALLAGAFVLLHLAYVVRVGGDWMPFGRFVLPAVPLLVVLVGVGSEDLIGRLVARWPRAGWVALAPALALAFLLAARMDHRFINEATERKKLDGVTEQRNNVRSFLRAAEFLREVVPPGARLVTDYGGVFSCYTEGAVIEMWGLANAAIATRGDTEQVNPIYGRTCPACYPALDPEYFHVAAPLVRSPGAFQSAAEAIAAVWQTGTIGRYIDFPKTFAVGMVARNGEALYFLQKRSLIASFAPRTTPHGYVVSYPFEAAKAQK